MDTESHMILRCTALILITGYRLSFRTFHCQVINSDVCVIHTSTATALPIRMSTHKPDRLSNGFVLVRIAADCLRPCACDDDIDDTDITNCLPTQTVGKVE